MRLPISAGSAVVFAMLTLGSAPATACGWGGWGGCGCAAYGYGYGYDDYGGPAYAYDAPPAYYARPAYAYAPPAYYAPSGILCAAGLPRRSHLRFLRASGLRASASRLLRAAYVRRPLLRARRL